MNAVILLNRENPTNLTMKYILKHIKKFEIMDTISTFAQLGNKPKYYVVLMCSRSKNIVF